MLLSWLCLLSLIVICNGDQCIRYEFHETAINQEGNAELLINDCRTKNSKVTDYNVNLLQIYGPSMINITFNCCSSLPCRNDLQCPFNFNCNRGKCLVADDCNLRDEMEIVGEENQECIIDEDCYFKVPLDKKHWSCLSETSECVHKENCLRKCKRCAFAGGDHWTSNFVNNTIDAGLYNNESPSTSLIDDLLVVRNNNLSTSTQATPANSLVEFNLNSLINEPEPDSNDEGNGFSRLLDNNNRNVNNNLSNILTNSTTTSSSSTNRTSSNRSSSLNDNNGDLFNSSVVNSTTIPNRFISPNNLTSILELINSNNNFRLNTSPDRSTSRPNTSRSTIKPEASSGFTSNDLPTNIIDELPRRSIKPILGSSTSTTTTTTTTTTSTTTTTAAPPLSSSSEESSNESSSNEFNSNRINTTIDDFLFTRTIGNRRDSSEESPGSPVFVPNNSTDESSPTENNNNNVVDLFSSIINNSSVRDRSPISSISVPFNSSTRLNGIRTSDPFNSPFNSLFNSPSTTTKPLTNLNASTNSSLNNNSTTSTSTTTTTTTTTPTPLSTSAVLSASSILNRSRSANRNTDSNRFATRRSSSLRTNSARSILNNHRLVHLSNSERSGNNNRINNRNNNRRAITSTSTTTSTTTRPPPPNNNPYYHLTSILNNHNAYNEMLPGIMYAMEDIDIPRLNYTAN